MPSLYYVKEQIEIDEHVFDEWMEFSGVEELLNFSGSFAVFIHQERELMAGSGAQAIWEEEAYLILECATKERVDLNIVDMFQYLDCFLVRRV